MTGDPRIEARVLSVLVGVAVACAIKAALEKHNLSGKVVLLGTPGNPACDPKLAAIPELLSSGRRRLWEGRPPRKRRLRWHGCVLDVCLFQMSVGQG